MMKLKLRVKPVLSGHSEFWDRWKLNAGCNAILLLQNAWIFLTCIKRSPVLKPYFCHLLSGCLRQIWLYLTYLQVIILTSISLNIKLYERELDSLPFLSADPVNTLTVVGVEVGIVWWHNCISYSSKDSTITSCEERKVWNINFNGLFLIVVRCIRPSVDVELIHCLSILLAVIWNLFFKYN